MHAFVRKDIHLFEPRDLLNSLNTFSTNITLIPSKNIASILNSFEIKKSYSNVPNDNKEITILNNLNFDEIPFVI